MLRCFVKLVTFVENYILKISIGLKQLTICFKISAVCYCKHDSSNSGTRIIEYFGKILVIFH